MYKSDESLQVIASLNFRDRHPISNLAQAADACAVSLTGL
jgi:hypothetical protein